MISKENTENILALSAENVHETVFAILEEENLKKGSLILDAASGRGAFTKRLSDKGYEIVPVDVEVEQFLFDKCSPLEYNLNYNLPFNDNSFDAVISIETMEHLWNPFGFLKEVNRILKSNAVFIFTSPNPSNIFSKILFMISGRFSWFRKVDFIEHGHISPIFSWQLKQIIPPIGFNIDKYTFNQFHIPFTNFKFRNNIFQKEILGQIAIWKLRKK